MIWLKHSLLVPMWLCVALCYQAQMNLLERLLKKAMVRDGKLIEVWLRKRLKLTGAEDTRHLRVFRLGFHIEAQSRTYCKILKKGSAQAFHTAERATSKNYKMLLSLFNKQQLVSERVEHT